MEKQGSQEPEVRSQESGVRMEKQGSKNTASEARHINSLKKHKIVFSSSGATY
jgi:hypothetical protein